tara:strand:+ start:6324 stop:6683 length:360 start_codon:yes stop_codon:yes gene_type:complete
MTFATIYPKRNRIRFWKNCKQCTFKELKPTLYMCKCGAVRKRFDLVEEIDEDNHPTGKMIPLAGADLVRNIERYTKNGWEVESSRSENSGSAEAEASPSAFRWLKLLKKKKEVKQQTEK